MQVSSAGADLSVVFTERNNVCRERWNQNRLKVFGDEIMWPCDFIVFFSNANILNSKVISWVFFTHRDYMSDTAHVHLLCHSLGWAIKSTNVSGQFRMMRWPSGGERQALSYSYSVSYTGGSTGTRWDVMLLLLWPCQCRIVLSLSHLCLYLFYKKYIAITAHR